MTQYAVFRNDVDGSDVFYLQSEKELDAFLEDPRGWASITKFRDVLCPIDELDEGEAILAELTILVPMEKTKSWRIDHKVK